MSGWRTIQIDGEPVWALTWVVDDALCVAEAETERALLRLFEVVGHLSIEERAKRLLIVNSRHDGLPARTIQIDGEPVWELIWERDPDALRWDMRTRWIADPERWAASNPSSPAPTY